MCVRVCVTYVRASVCDFMLLSCLLSREIQQQQQQQRQQQQAKQQPTTNLNWDFSYYQKLQAPILQLSGELALTLFINNLGLAHVGETVQKYVKYLI